MWKYNENSSKMPLKERGGVPDQEHPVLNNTAILAKQLKKAICLNRPYIQKYQIHQHKHPPNMAAILFLI